MPIFKQRELIIPAIEEYFKNLSIPEHLVKDLNQAYNEYLKEKEINDQRILESEEEDEFDDEDEYDSLDIQYNRHSMTVVK